MRNLILLFCCFFYTIYNVAAQSSSSPNPLLATDGSLGTVFFIAIPPNELHPYATDELEVYISSAYDTEVTVTDYSGSSSHKYKVQAGKVRVLSTSSGELNWGMELQGISEQVEKRAIGITSPKPISVTVLNSKHQTSDSYLALPVSEWGVSYIPCSFYDFNDVRNWAGGFVLIAAQDNTEIDILLRGEGELDGRTLGGTKINTGNHQKVILHKGDVYQVKGDGTSRGVFDLSGSLITSNKPIGCISFHERTTMPNQLENGNGRNHLVEMNYPTDRWGKEYVTVNYTRDQRTTQGSGDVFRVVALDSNTTFTVEYFDAISKQRIGTFTKTIHTAGGIITFTQTPRPMHLISGLSKWTANKPIQVVQYSTSSSFDGNPTLDPFMINLVPVDRYPLAALSTIGSTSAKFPKTHLSVFVATDSTSDSLTIIEDLKSIIVGGKPLWSHPDAQKIPLLTSKIPGTTIYCAKLERDFSTSSLEISANRNVRVWGYYYMFGNFDAAGTSLGGLKRIYKNIEDTKEIDDTDTIPPTITVQKINANRYSVDIQDKNLASTRILIPGFFDYSVGSIIEAANPKNRTQKIEATLTNSKVFTKATFYAEDESGNSARYTLTHTGRILELTKVGVQDSTFVDSTLTIPYSARVLLDTNTTVLGVEIQSISGGVINSTHPQLPFSITEERTFPINITAVSSSPGEISGNLAVITAEDTIIAPIYAVVVENPSTDITIKTEDRSELVVLYSIYGTRIIPTGNWSTATIRDLRGITVRVIQNTSEIPFISVSGMNAGVYTVEVQCGSTVQSAVFVVQ